MKRLLLLTFCLLPFAFAQLAPAQVFNYPAQGPTMTQFLSLSNSIPAATNSVTRNGTNTLTGTNAFTAAGFYPANNLGLRLLWSSPTNVYIANMATSATAAFTNNGDFSLGSYVASGTIPPLLGSNSTISVSYEIVKTNASNAGQTAGQLYYYIGSNTNFIGYSSSAFSTTMPGIQTVSLLPVVKNWNATNSQIQSGSIQNPGILAPTNFFNSSVSNTFYISASTATGRSNDLINIRVWEFYAP